ncbi:MAG: tetratricopeptide repeat protein [Xanthomonadales bacterium]|nr:tetratricopeptide repeat protein [Xanthomonadales bacterium]
MSFFEELKRRNVFRVGIAYAISAWVLLQIVDLVLDNITAPEWIMQVFMLAVAVGFPIAVIIAWAFEMTPDGVKLEKHVDRSKSITQKTGQKINRNISIVLAIAVVFLLVDRFTPDSDTTTLPAKGSEASVAAVTPQAKTPEKSIAVLPFVDMSPESDQAYFADGISEEILNVLVKTQSLKVAGRTSSFQFRDGTTDLKEIGEQLGVAHLLEGSIRKANNRVRITAQLVTASDGFHLWSETYDRELTDIFAIQDEIARAITKALAIELNLTDSSQSLVTASTSNMEAYDHYLEARGLIARRIDFPRSIELLDEVTRMDPNFAAGWAAGAQAHSLSYYYGNYFIKINREMHLDRAEAMANRALEIDPNLSMAYSVLGDVYRDRNQWALASKNYLRALALNPDNVEANEQYAQLLWRALFIDEAFKYSLVASNLDPLSWLNLTVNASIRYIKEDQMVAWAEMDQALQRAGDNQDYPLRLAVRMAINDGNLEKAIELMKALTNSPLEIHDSPLAKVRYSELIAILDSKEKTLSFLTAGLNNAGATGADRTWGLDVFWAAYYGDYELAERILTMGLAADEGFGNLADTTWLGYTIINPLHSSEPYKQMIRELKLDSFWRENGFPDSCRPLGEDDFACN